MVAWMGQPAPVVILIVVLATTRLSGRYGWLTSWALVLTASAVAIVGLFRLSSYLEPDVGIMVTAIWSVIAIGLSSAEMVWPSRAFTRRTLAAIATAAAMPIGLGLAFFAYYVQQGGRWISWAMASDTAWRTRTVRWILDDGGSTVRHLSPDPLTGVVNAAWSARRYDPDSPGVSLHHLVVQGAQVSILFWLCVSLTVAALTAASLRDRARGVQMVGAAVGALLPWTWYMAGYSFEYGFQSVGPSVLLILCAWILWRGSEQHTVICLGGLTVTTTALVMTWAPLGAVAAALVVAVIIHRRRNLRAGTRLEWACVVLALIVSGAYAFGVALRAAGDIGTSAFATDGAIITFHPARLAALLAVAAIICVIRAARTPDTVWWGAAWAVGAVLAVCAYLLHLRQGTGTLWGYYPVKFAWLCSCGLLLISYTALVSPLGRWSTRRWGGNGTAAAAAVVLITMTCASPVPPTTGGPFAPRNLQTTHLNDPGAATIFSLYQKHPYALATSYADGFDGPQNDGFANFWLLQLDAEDADDPVRGMAYALNSRDLQGVCETIRIWERPEVFVATTNRLVGPQLARICGQRAGAYVVGMP